MSLLLKQSRKPECGANNSAPGLVACAAPFAFHRRLPLVLLIFALCASTLTAQYKKKERVSTLRDVQGTVSDVSGKPVTGAVVQLKNTKNLEIISFITRDQGDYYFHGLSPDIDFQISAEHGGKVSAIRTLSSFDTRKQAVVNLKLDKDKKS